MKRYWYLILCSIFFAKFAIAAVTAQVDPAKAQVGETIRLIITMDGVQTAGIPNLIPLQKDFSIISTERSLTYTMLNGQSQSAMQWVIYLSPKTIGTIELPAIKIGQEQTKPLQIEVTKGPVPAAADQQPVGSNVEDVMLKAEVSQDKPWMNQQVLYTVRLYNSSQRLLDANYTPPQIDNALLVPLGEGRRYQSLENGRSYNVEEQLYAIFPQKSGPLELVAPSLQALVYDNIPRRINAQGKNIVLDVQPIPAQFTGKYWLPAKQLQISDEYDKKGNAVHEGSTIVRTITLEGTGVPAQLLPTLSFEGGTSFNTYPEKPEVQNTAHGKDLVGTSIIKVTYLFNQSGSVTIPSLQVPWFNTTTGKEEIASLPPYTLTVTPKVGGTLPTNAPVSTLPKQNSDTAQDIPTVSSTSISSNNLAWGLAIGFALAWLLTMLMAWLKPTYFSISKLQKARKKLQKACLNNDAAQARSALLHWASAQWPDEEFLNLNDLAHWVHSVPFKKQLHLLSQALYSQEMKSSWRGRDLWNAVQEFRHKKTPKTYKVRDLPPINPI